MSTHSGPDSPSHDGGETARRDPEEIELVARARGGCEDAQGELLERLEPALRRYMRARMGTRLRRFASMDDLVQEVFARGLRALGRLNENADVDDVRGLLFQHARWVLRDHGRNAGHFAGESADARALGVRASDSGLTGSVTRRDEAFWLSERVSQLSDKYASVVKLYLEGRSTAEIAELLDLREETARKRLLRAAGQLRQNVSPDSPRGRAGER